MKIGDKVRIVKDVPYGPAWNEVMPQLIGQAGVVESMDSDVKVRFSDHDGDKFIDRGYWYYHEDSLEVIPEFKIGDRVRVIGRFEDESGRDGIEWADGMDKTLGKIGKIVDLVLTLDPPRFGVEFERVGYYYLPHAIKLVLPKPVKEPVNRAVGKAVKFFECFATKIGVVDSVIEGTYYIMCTDEVLYSRKSKHTESLDVRFEYYRVPAETYHLPDKPNQTETEKQLIRYVKSARWNFMPHGKGGAVVARAVVNGSQLEGVSICSLEDNFDWAEGRRLAVLNLASA